MNARRTLAKLLEWGVVPVINENDTTATDEISFGDNDILAAQVAILMSADLLVVLSDVDGLYTSDPGSDPAPQLVPEVHDLAELRQLRDRDVELAHRLGRDAQQGAVRRDGDLGGHPGRDLQRHASRARCCGPSRASRSGTRFHPQARRAVELQAVAEVREERARDGAGRPGRRARAARAGHEPAAGRRGRGGGRLRGRRRGRGGRGRRRAARRSARGSPTTRRRSCAA